MNDDAGGGGRQFLYDFLEALITQQTSPEEAFVKFDALCARHGETVRRTGAHLKEVRRQQNSSTAVNAAMLAHDQALELYSLSVYFQSTFRALSEHFHDCLSGSYQC